MKVIPKYQFGNKAKKQNYEWTRLRTAKGYVYAKTRNGQAIEYSPNGFFRVYEKPDSNSHSYETTFENAGEGNIPSVQRKPDNHAAAVAQQKEIDEKVNQTANLTPLFANLMTGGYATIAQNASEDIKNGHYLSGGMKMVSPLIVPAFARAPMKMAKGFIGAELAGNVSDYIWARTMGGGKTFSNDLSDATGGRISEEEGRILNPGTWWGFKLGMDSHHWRPNGHVGMNGAPNSSAAIEDP